MTVILTSPVEGLDVGAEYTGANEVFLLENGYAKKKAGSNAGVDPAHPTGIAYDHPEPGAEDNAPNPGGDTSNLPPIAPETLIGTKSPTHDELYPTHGPARTTKDATLLPEIDPATALGSESAEDEPQFGEDLNETLDTDSLPEIAPETEIDTEVPTHDELFPVEGPANPTGPGIGIEAPDPATALGDEDLGGDYS